MAELNKQADAAISALWEALALAQPHANANGYGPEWASMLQARTTEAAARAAAAARAQTKD